MLLPVPVGTTFRIFAGFRLACISYWLDTLVIVVGGLSALTLTVAIRVIIVHSGYIVMIKNKTL
ncbi:hypothetical protein OAH23_08505 [Verrucomicrobia bacterium]|nr:hypothetical protein [Verrucomicrobiota bacterium]MDB4690445.1 hypothetical protein [Verrucomicrobiota bacterium]